MLAKTHLISFDIFAYQLGGLLNDMYLLPKFICNRFFRICSNSYDRYDNIYFRVRKVIATSNKDIFLYLIPMNFWYPLLSAKQWIADNLNMGQIMCFHGQPCNHNAILRRREVLVYQVFWFIKFIKFWYSNPIR